MKNVTNKLLVLFGIIIVLYACNGDDDQTVLSSDKEILAFDLIDNVFSEIDSQENTIVITVPFGTDITALAPSIAISENATVSPEGGAVRDFTNPVTYTVTAQDGVSSTIYQISISVNSVDLDSDREALRAIYYANGSITRVPLDNRGWDVDNPDSDIEMWGGGVSMQDGRVVILGVFNAALTIIPLEMGNLTRLEELYLIANRLTTVPPKIVQLVNLKFLELGNNELVDLPVEIGNLNNLVDLDLRENQLQALPTTIGNLNNLVNLILSENLLQELPFEIGNLENLISLVVDDNRLTTVPPEIRLIIGLDRLNLRQNPIVELPFTICNLIDAGVDVRIDDIGVISSACA